MNTRQRIQRLESARPANVDNTIHVFILTEDGGAYTYTAGNETTYTAAEYAEHVKQCEARGEKFIHVAPASMDTGGEHGNE